MFTSFLETKTMAQNLIWIITLYDLIDWLAHSIHLLFHIRYTSDHFLHQSINCLVYKMYESKKKKIPNNQITKKSSKSFDLRNLNRQCFDFLSLKITNYLLIIDWWIDQLISSFSLNAHHIFGWGLCCSYYWSLPRSVLILCVKIDFLPTNVRK